jgi:hypothetical protein
LLFAVACFTEPISGYKAPSFHTNNASYKCEDIAPSELGLISWSSSALLALQQLATFLLL